MYLLQKKKKEGLVMSNSLPQNIEQALQLIGLLYHVNLTVIHDHQALEAFSLRYRFHPLQHMFSPDNLRKLLRDLDERKILLLTDAFKVRSTLFTLDGVPVLFGPFTSVLLTERDVKSLLLQYPLPDVSEGELLYYLNSFPCLPETQVSSILTSLLQVLYPEERARDLVSINYLEKAEFETEAKLASQREDYTRLLEQRYAYEQSFIQSVQEGSSRKAIQALHSMQMDVAYLKRIGTTLENERVGAAIVRTTARLSALQAGLPSLITDRIPRENTAACFRAVRVDEIIRAQEKMVRDFCKAVRASRGQSHSALVQSALYCIENEYAGEISMQSLAEELDVSVNHLISVFKKEMHVTPNVYLREHRLKQAARILAATDQSVQEVAAAVGIPDANYMIKLFKAQFGETPTAYRRKYRI